MGRHHGCCGVILALACVALIAVVLVGVFARPGDASYDAPGMLGTEQTLFDPDTTWHNGVTVDVSPSVAIAYKLSSNPKIVPNNITTVTYRRTSNVERNLYSYFSAHLLLGSSASVTVRLVDGSSVLHLGLKAMCEKQFKRFINGRSYETLASAQGLPNTTEFYAGSEDNYFFVVENSYLYASYNLTWRFSLAKTFYDVSAAKEVCSNTAHCKFTVKGSETIVVEVPYSYGTTNSVQVSIDEQFNNQIWWIIFGCVIGFLALMVALSIIGCLCRCFFNCLCCCCKSDEEDNYRPIQ